ncbi:PEBP-like protein [Hymenopellis radicata]|nr:PEBP-like protein [Hymenopellis radicata]
MISLVAVSLSLLPFVASQSDTATGIAAIKAHFTQSHIVPDLFDSFNPIAVLAVNYPGVGDITPGQTLTQAEAGGYPTIKVTAANSSVALGDTFTVAMVDASYVGKDDSDVTRHWLLNSATLGDGTISNSSAVAITEYAGPAPPEGDPAHRYVIAVYQQPSAFSAPADFSQANMGVSTFDFESYLEDSKMGALVGATYITVQTGTATMSVSATSSVDSATLSVASGTGGGSSGTRTATGSAASSTQSGNGAMGLSLGKFSVALGLLGFVMA